MSLLFSEGQILKTMKFKVEYPDGDIFYLEGEATNGDELIKDAAVFLSETNFKSNIELKDETLTATSVYMFEDEHSKLTVVTSFPKGTTVGDMTDKVINASLTKLLTAKFFVIEEILQ